MLLLILLVKTGIRDTIELRIDNLLTRARVKGYHVVKQVLRLRTSATLTPPAQAFYSN